MIEPIVLILNGSFIFNLSFWPYMLTDILKQQQIRFCSKAVASSPRSFLTKFENRDVMMETAPSSNFQPQSIKVQFDGGCHCASSENIKDADGLSFGGHWSPLLYCGVKMKSRPQTKRGRIMFQGFMILKSSLFTWVHKKLSGKLKFTYQLIITSSIRLSSKVISKLSSDAPHDNFKEKHLSKSY